MKKIPFPVSINEELAERIKLEVESGKYRNRSHLVEQAIIEFKKKSEEASDKFAENKDEQ